MQSLKLKELSYANIDDNLEIQEIEEEFTLISELYKEISEIVSTQGKDINLIEDNISKLELDTKEIEKEVFISEELQKENLFEVSKEILFASGVGGITLGSIYLFTSPANILAGMIGGVILGGLSGLFFSK